MLYVRVNWSCVKTNDMSLIRGEIFLFKWSINAINLIEISSLRACFCHKHKISYVNISSYAEIYYIM